MAESVLTRTFSYIGGLFANNERIILRSVIVAANLYFIYTLTSVLPERPARRSSRSFFGLWGPKKSRKADAVPGEQEAEQKLVARLQSLDLNSHEETVAEGIIAFMSSEAAGFDQIGGLEEVISDLKEFVIFPLRFPQFYCCKSSSDNGEKKNDRKNLLLSAPRGVLFYGPPGCGKTMLARAIAKEANSTFINVHVSTLTDKYFGESQKLVKAIFSLAKKMQPSIIFIDEIDGFLRTRRQMDHDALNLMKTEFLTLWDGLNSAESDAIIVIGATNRPQDLDEAVLRRLPRKYKIQHPNATHRLSIIQLILSGISLEPDFNFNEIVAKTEGYSGSDLKELCRRSAMTPYHEILKKSNGNIEEFEQQAKECPESIKVRPLRNSDFFFTSLKELRPQNSWYHDVNEL